MERRMECKVVDVETLSPNPFQPREQFDEERLGELANSLKSRGDIQPVVVREHDEGYQIIAGERRWRAAKLAVMKTIPVLGRETAEEDILLESLIENLHREDLTDMERENAIYHLWKSGRFKTKADLARTLGVTSTRVSSDIEAKEFREKVPIDQVISTEAIRASRGIPTEERKRVIEKVSKGELGVRETWTATKVLKRASEPVKKAILKPQSRITPRMAEKVLELPEEKQAEAIRHIEDLRLDEDEVVSHIEAMKVEVPLPPPAEFEKVRERYEDLQKEFKARLATPEAQERGALFRNWASHIAVAGIVDSISCPICKSKELGWICHRLTIQKALEEAEKRYKEDLNRNKAQRKL